MPTQIHETFDLQLCLYGVLNAARHLGVKFDHGPTLAGPHLDALPEAESFTELS